MNAHPIAIRSILLCAWGIGAVCTTALFLYRIITELRFFWKRRIFLTKRREMLVYSVSGYRNVSSVGKSIYLGEALGLDDVELDYIIRHEEAHYRNKDTLKNIGMMIYSSVFWFLPTNVLMTRWIRRDCEIASDLYATKGLSDCEKKKYCFLLLSLKKAKKQTLAMAFSEEYEDLAARIDAIKNNDGTKKKRRLVVSLTVGVILLAVFLLLIGKSCIHIPEKGKLDISKDVYVKNFIIEDGVAKFRLVNNSDTPYIIYKATIEEQTDDGWREVYKATKRKKEKCYGILPETEWLRILVPEETEVSDISRDDYLHYIRVFKVDTDNWEENGAYVLDLYITNEQRPYIVELVQFSFEK